jgi:NAD(P)-dependent dehydrogenase (short-subunit alcohol dehydrogenase family)
MLLAVACSSFVPPDLGRYAFESRRTTKVQMSSKAPLRREVLQLGALGLLGSTLPLSPAEAEELELVVSQAQLLANLASAPTRNIIITGANSGVGLAGAKLLTAAGHSVTLACRTQAKADAAADACNAYAASTSADGPTGLANFYSTRRAGGVARGMACDLSSLASVRSFAQEQQSRPLDSLVLNAGLSMNVADKEPKRTADGFELTVGTNHLGHFALAKLLLPTLSKGTNPRLVITASGVHDPASEGGKQGGPEKWATVGDLKGLEGGPNFSMVDGGVYDPDKAYKDSKLCNSNTRDAHPRCPCLAPVLPLRCSCEPCLHSPSFPSVALASLACTRPPHVSRVRPRGYPVLFMAEAARRYSTTLTVNAFSPGLIADPST